MHHCQFKKVLFRKNYCGCSWGCEMPFHPKSDLFSLLHLQMCYLWFFLKFVWVALLIRFEIPVCMTGVNIQYFYNSNCWQWNTFCDDFYHFCEKSRFFHPCWLPRGCWESYGASPPSIFAQTLNCSFAAKALRVLEDFACWLPSMYLCLHQCEQFSNFHFDLKTWNLPNEKNTHVILFTLFQQTTQEWWIGCFTSYYNNYHWPWHMFTMLYRYFEKCSKW